MDELSDRSGVDSSRIRIHAISMATYNTGNVCISSIMQGRRRSEGFISVYWRISFSSCITLYCLLCIRQDPHHTVYKMQQVPLLLLVSQFDYVAVDLEAFTLSEHIPSQIGRNGLLFRTAQTQPCSISTFSSLSLQSPCLRRHSPAEQ